MKKNLIFVIVLILTIILNPNEKNHISSIKDKYTEIISKNIYYYNADSLSVGNGKTTLSEIFEKHIDYSNYYLFSTSSINNQVISFGIFSNVFISGNKLENNLKFLLIKLTNFFTLDFFEKSNKYLNDIVDYNEYKLKVINPISEERNKATIVSFEKNKFSKNESDITFGEPYLLVIKNETGYETMVFLGDIDQLKDGLQKDAFFDKLKAGNKFLYESIGEGKHELYHEYFKKILFYQ